MDVNKKVKESIDNYKKMTSENSPEDFLKVKDNVKSEYSMFGLIFNQIAILRTRTSDAGVMVRLNNQSSPEYLDIYHTLIYSFLEQVSVIIPDYLWKKIFKMWVETKNEIIKYQKRRNAIHNLKIPQDIINRLDRLHRVSLLAAQRANLGINLVNDVDINRAIEDAVVGN